MAADPKNTESARIGPLALAHPVVAVGLAIWLINDHVLKATYGSWWTGKLTDLVALIVFPVLVATALERLVTRPMPTALVFTLLFYGSINLFAAADSATERVMSLVIDSTLTRDPTDLLLLPVMAGAWWVWNRPVHSQARLRRTWGRTVFALGVATTLATSPDTAQSQEFSGTVLLTEDEPSVSIPYSVRIEGDLAVARDFYELTRMASTSFAMNTPDTTLPVAGDLVDLASTQRDDGSWNLVLALTDPAFAPVEVQWTFAVETEGSGGLFFGDDAPIPVLTMTPPQDEVGPEPLASLSDPEFSEAVRAWEWVVTAPADAELAVGVPRGARIERLVVGTVDGEVALSTGFLTPVPAPTSCAADPCTFSVWIATGERDLGFDIEMYGPPEVEVVAAREHRMVLTSQDFTTRTVSSDIPLEVDLIGTLELPEPTDPIDQLTRMVELDAHPTLEVETDDFWYGASARVTDDYSRQPTLIRQCCDPVMVHIFFNTRNERFDLAETAAVVRVGVWSLEQLDPNDITLTFDE